MNRFSRPPEISGYRGQMIATSVGRAGTRLTKGRHNDALYPSAGTWDRLAEASRSCVGQGRCTIVDSSSEASAAVTARRSLLCEPFPAGSDNLHDCFRQLPLHANAGFAADLDEAALCHADAASSRQHRRALAVMPQQAKPYLRMVLPQPNQGTCLPDRPGSSEQAVIVTNPVSPFPWPAS